MASAATAAVGTLARTGSAQAPPGITDADILNFALNLEYLEAEFYTVATQGKTIDQVGIGITGSGTQGATTGGKQVNFTDAVTRDIANQIADDERAHVSLIRGALTAAGAMPVARPAIKLDALGIGFNSQAEFLTLARAFEDVGVTAYAGAAPLISDKMILGAAARIAEVESEHAAGIRLLVAQFKVPTAQLDGVDILPPPTGVEYFSVDAMGLTQVRSPGQVLYIVYGGKANATGGGFYPNGMNGKLNMSDTGIPITAPTLNASVTPVAGSGTFAGSTLTTTPGTAVTSVVLDASKSTPAMGVTYLFSYLGGLQPAILQSPNSPTATIQLVNGPGTYMLQLVVTDASGMKSAPTPITIVRST
ncbi:MAG: ferritin-like domain-containing protein [Acidobacteriota bacterium]|nr:ferritin-like domain-containing protein [Acidobacteriota bacterium]